jgi:hypothetical protein
VQPAMLVTARFLNMMENNQNTTRGEVERIALASFHPERG